MTRFFLLLIAQIWGLQNLLTAEKLAEILTANSDSSSPIQTLKQKLIQIFSFLLLAELLFLNLISAYKITNQFPRIRRITPLT